MPQMMAWTGCVPPRGTSSVNSSHLAAAAVHTADVDGKEEEAGKGGRAGRSPATREETGGTEEREEDAGGGGEARQGGEGREEERGGCVVLRSSFARTLQG